MKTLWKALPIALLLALALIGVAPRVLGATCASSTLYWVGGAGSAGETSHWSGSSGGSAGCFPDHVNVIFDSASGSGNVTVSRTVYWHSFTITPTSSIHVIVTGAGQIILSGTLNSGGLANGGMDILANAISVFYIILFFVVLGVIVAVALTVRKRL